MYACGLGTNCSKLCYGLAGLDIAPKLSSEGTLQICTLIQAGALAPNPYLLISRQFDLDSDENLLGDLV